MGQATHQLGSIYRYWEDEDQTKKAMKEDEEGTVWMHTGDEGIMDNEGYLRSQFDFLHLPFLVNSFATLTVVGRIKVGLTRRFPYHPS